MKRRRRAREAAPSLPSGPGSPPPQALPSDPDPKERSRLGAFLKLLVNATNRGVFAAMNRRDSRGKATPVAVHGIDAMPFAARAAIAADASAAD
jgi:hypothetical protein